MSQRRIYNNVQAAKALNCSEMMIRKYRKRCDWPFGRRRWPTEGVSVEQLRTWKLKAIGPSSKTENAKLEVERRARLKLLRERAKLLQLERMIREGQLIPLAEVEADAVRRIYAAKSALADVGPRLACELVGLQPPEIERKITEAISEALRPLSEPADRQ